MKILVTLMSVVFLTGGSPTLAEPIDCQLTVKLSRSGICHTPSSPFYAEKHSSRTFQAPEDCPKPGRSSKAKTDKAISEFCTQHGVLDANRYDRALFGNWADASGNCMNTRHELLQSLSTGPVTISSSGCSVVRGRWLDPYTNQIFIHASELDIDHLVPLAYAWARGASAWTDAERAAFFNDQRNLFVVSSKVNRSKGSRGPTEWLPPNAEFHCQYVTRFQRMVLTFKIRPSIEEWSKITEVRETVCGRD